MVRDNSKADNRISLDYISPGLVQIGGLIWRTCRHVGLTPYRPNEGMLFSAGEMSPVMDVAGTLSALVGAQQKIPGVLFCIRYLVACRGVLHFLRPGINRDDLVTVGTGSYNGGVGALSVYQRR